MKYFEIIIKLTAALGTPLTGDTLFGHFCWQAAHKPEWLDGGGLDPWIDLYPDAPFAVFSSAWPRLSQDGKIKYALKRPDLPLQYLVGEEMGDGEAPDDPGRDAAAYDQAKSLKKKKWMLVNQDLQWEDGGFNLLTDHDLFKLLMNQLDPKLRRTIRKAGVDGFQMTEKRYHNTIHRLTGTTGTGQFAPFTHEVTSYLPGVEWSIFVWVDEKATDKDRIKKSFCNIGKYGFGRDASTGMGRFTVVEVTEKPWPVDAAAEAVYTLGPCVPEKGLYARKYFNPFVRFGKHGDYLAAGPNPFKNPVLMAGEGAVFIPDDLGRLQKKQYLGRAVTGVSKAEPKTVVQGYTLFLPLRLEAGHATG